ncbi:DUF2024 domain-containing protein [Sesbania bispinosa]|nr:DUF2024 domain-containing protein [Sesbania bispinosa]
MLVDSMISQLGLRYFNYWAEDLSHGLSEYPGIKKPQCKGCHRTVPHPSVLGTVGNPLPKDLS